MQRLAYETCNGELSFSCNYLLYESNRIVKSTEIERKTYLKEILVEYRIEYPLTLMAMKNSINFHKKFVKVK